jgi:hypothetical protein
MLLHVAGAFGARFRRIYDKTRSPERFLTPQSQMSVQDKIPDLLSSQRDPERLFSLLMSNIPARV